jgi:DNA-binding response OmpR family regulator
VLKEREVERIDTVTGAFRGHVLVIEDETRIAQMLTEYLQRRGYHVTTINNGEEALLQLQLVKPRIVILDILLPGMDGLLTLQQIKARAPGVSVIVSSGFEDPELMQQAKALGACAYLVKPFSLAKLEAAMVASTLPSS